MKPLIYLSLVLGILACGQGGVSAWANLSYPVVKAYILSGSDQDDLIAGNTITAETIDKDLVSFPLFNYYLTVEFQDPNPTDWGIAMYTNNGRSNLAELQQGGLRPTVPGSDWVQFYWRVYDEKVAPANLTFNAGQLSSWGRMQENMAAVNPEVWNSAENVKDRTIVGARGLGVYPQSGRNQFHSPVYLYFGMDLTHVSQSNTFTATIRLDLYNLNTASTQGGYAAPNPFTPATGQVTEFQFFTPSVNTGFEIRIFNLRGRLERILRNTKQWDGRDGQGKLLEGGLYIYQISVENKRISGTVVLIK
jgi:hypothetical protein